jgi:hypothetical protein
MKKIFTITFLTFLLFVPNFAQTTNNKELITSSPQTTNRDIEIKYDRFDDSTSINLKLKLTWNGKLSFSLSNSFSGKKRVSIPKSITVSFTNLYNQVLTQQDEYFNSRSCIFLVDDKRIRLDNGLYDRVETVGEFIVFSLSLENLKLITNAKKVEMRLDSSEFTLTDKQLESIKEFYKLLVP